MGVGSIDALAYSPQRDRLMASDRAAKFGMRVMFERPAASAASIANYEQDKIHIDGPPTVASRCGSAVNYVLRGLADLWTIARG